MGCSGYACKRNLGHREVKGKEREKVLLTLIYNF